MAGAAVRAGSRPGLIDDLPGGDAVAFVAGERRLTYSELGRRVDALAGGLWRLGVRRGDVVSFQLPNWIEGALMFFATTRLGAIANPIVPIYRGRELRFILRQSRARVIVIPARFRGVDYRALVDGLRPQLPELEHVSVVGEPSFEELLAGGGAPPALERDPGDVALLLYTSGTESDPKGVLHSHETLLYEARSIAELYRLGSEDRVLMPSPITHITGLVYGLLMPVLLRSRGVLQDVWSPERALELIERERCSVIIGATPFLHGLARSPQVGRRDVSSLRVFGCGGADVPPELIRHASRLLGMRASRLYGSTECPAVTGTPIDAPEHRHADSDGRPIGAAEARVVDERGAALPPGARGLLEVRGPERCLGYLDASLNERAFDPEGWFRTGDLAVMDDQGYVRIAGRAKDVIVRGGENISAKEVEDLLFEHPAVAEVAVVAYADETLGERACAVVVPAGGAELTLADLVEFLSRYELARQKLPERLWLVDALPKTASGKVQKYRLREQLRERLS